MEMADVVADVEVIDTSCGQEQSDWITSYVSQLKTIEVIKGQATDVLSYNVAQTAEQPGCGAQIVLAKGWVGRVYLQAYNDGTYGIEYSGGAVIDPQASILHELPVCQEPDPGPHYGPPLDLSSDPEPTVDPADPAEPTTASTTPPTAGCSAAAPRAHGWLSALLVGLALVAQRRRRRG